MSQHDYVIDNQSAPNFRTDLNNALLAIATMNSGTSEPSTTYANQLWVDTTNDQLKIRNEDNDAWIVVADLDQVGDKSAPPDASITFAKLAAAAVVTESETIASNDNDTTIPTSAAVDAHIPAKLNASGSAPIYACRAWVVFDGTTGSIAASGNVSSVLRNSVGNYTITFSTAMQDTNYAVVAQSGALTDTSSVLAIPIVGRTTTEVAILLRNDGGLQRDSSYVSLAVFR